MPRYDLRFCDSRIPKAEVTVPTVVAFNPYRVHHAVIRRFWGVTRSHAYNRALRWSRENGGTR